MTIAYIPSDFLTILIIMSRMNTWTLEHNESHISLCLNGMNVGIVTNVEASKGGKDSNSEDDEHVLVRNPN